MNVQAQRCKPFIVFLTMALMSAAATADTPDSADPDSTDNADIIDITNIAATVEDRATAATKLALEKAEALRHELSQNWLETSRNIDSWLSSSQSQGMNKSRINLGLKQLIGKSGDMESDFFVRGKLDIPNTKRKFKLFIDSDTDDQRSLEDRKLNVVDDGDTTLGLGRINQSENFKIETDIGAKVRVPFDPFIRTKAVIDGTLNDDWGHGFEQRLWYYHQRGWGESSEYYLLREYDIHHALKISSEAQYQHRDEELELGQFFTLYQNIPENHWRSYTFGITGSNKPNVQVDSYFISTSYKRLIYKDWVALSLDPRLRFPREDSWKANPELEIRIEIFFQESH